MLGAAVGVSPSVDFGAVGREAESPAAAARAVGERAASKAGRLLVAKL